MSRPDGIGTVLSEERERFDTIKDRLRNLLLKELREFRYIFPFGRPEGTPTPCHTAGYLRAVRSCTPSLSQCCTLRVVSSEYSTECPMQVR